MPRMNFSRRMTFHRLVVAGLALLALTSGCVPGSVAGDPGRRTGFEPADHAGAGSSGAASWGAGASIIDDSRSDPQAPAELRERDGFRSCGEIVVLAGRSAADFITDEMRACSAAVDAAGAGGEIAVQSSLAEDSPTVRYYRVGPGIDGVIWFRFEQDPFEAGAWEYAECLNAESLVDALTRVSPCQVAAVE